MTILAIGSSVTLSVGDGGFINVATGGGLAVALITPTVGTASTVNLGPLAERRRFGIFTEGAQVTVTNVSCAGFDYDYSGSGLTQDQVISVQALVAGTGLNASGIRPRAFRPAVPFDVDYSYIYNLVGSPIAFTVDPANQTLGAWALYELVADAVNVPTFAASIVRQSTSTSYDNTSGRVNLIGFFKNTSGYTYTISQGGLVSIPDVIPPTVSSFTATNANTILVLFSEAVNATSSGWSFSNGSAVPIISVVGTGTNTLSFTTNSVLVNGQTITASYSAGTTGDLAGNPLATINGAAVTNSVPAANTPVALTFATRFNLTNSGTQFSKSGSVTNYDGRGIDAKVLPANTVGRVWMTCPANGAGVADGMFGFNTSAANTSYAASGYACVWPQAFPTLGAVVNGSIASTGNVGSFAYSDLIGVARKADGSLWIQKSSDSGTTWVDVYNTGLNSQAALYPVCMVQGSIYAPTGTGIA